MSSRDLFSGFERMRREVDELFGEVFDPHRRRAAFSPAVDVFYVGDPPRAVVHAELAGVNPDEVKVEVRGRELILARPPPAAAGQGPAVPADRDRARLVPPRRPARRRRRRRRRERRTTSDGILEITLPLVTERPVEPQRADHRPRGQRLVIDVTSGNGASRGARPARSRARRAILPLREAVAFPDTVLPLAVGQPRTVELVNDALASDRMVVLVASKDPELEEPPPDQLLRGRRRRRHRADDARRPTGRCASSSRPAPRVRIDHWVGRAAVPRGRGRGAARHGDERVAPS